MKPIHFLAVAWASSMLSAHLARAQEAVMEEVIVEAPFDVRLESPSETAVRAMTERMRLQTATQRAAELRVANQSPISTILDLTRYSPVRMGASENPGDLFGSEIYRQAELQPQTKRNPLFEEE